MDDSSRPPDAFFDGLRDGSPVAWAIVILIFVVIAVILASKWLFNNKE